MKTYDLTEIRVAFVSDIIETLVEKGYERNGDVPLYGHEHFPFRYNHGHDSDIVDMIQMQGDTFSILLANGNEIEPWAMNIEELNYFRFAVEKWVTNAEEKK